MEFAKKSLMLLLVALLTTGITTSQNVKVDVNSADIAELDSLPGVGPSIAKRIIEYREENGPFKRIEDLMNVQGIGEKKFLQLKDHVTAGGQAAPKKSESGKGTGKN